MQPCPALNRNVTTPNSLLYQVTHQQTFPRNPIYRLTLHRVHGYIVAKASVPDQRAGCQKEPYAKRLWIRVPRTGAEWPLIINRGEF
jgi:hypothetical protein